MAAGADGTGAAETVFGLHAVRHALERDPAAAIELRVQEDRLPAAAVRRILDLARAAAVAVRPIARHDLDRETGYARHQGVLLLRAATARRPAALEDLLARQGAAPALFLVLDGVEDPRNLGACVRAADAAGADAVIVPRDRAAPLTPAARKVASGAAESVPVLSVPNLARALRAMRDAGIWVSGTAADGEKELYDADLRLPSALVMGGEGRGLRRIVREHCDAVLRVPMHGAVESLNVAVAAGICLFEAVRQRRAAR